jgi:hypothetical protein
MAQNQVKIFDLAFEADLARVRHGTGIAAPARIVKDDRAVARQAFEVAREPCRVGN